MYYMKLRTLLFISFLMLSSATVFSRNLSDSVGVENISGKKVILHKLDAKDNYYSIGRRYNVRPNLIIQFNNNASLQVGSIIRVPTEQAFPGNDPVLQSGQSAGASTTQTEASTTASIVQYKVAAGETLYAIAKRFNTTVEDITKMNNLRNNNLSPGQIIRVTSAPAVIAPPVIPPPIIPAKRDSALAATTDSVTVERRLPANRYGLSEKNEKGIATWMDDDGLDSSKKLVLHRTAPIGTVIKITNPMTNRTTFAKVVGTFTDNQTNKDAIVVMTKGTAESLGALDKRFYVNISYGTPNDAQ